MITRKYGRASLFGLISAVSHRAFHLSPGPCHVSAPSLCSVYSLCFALGTLTSFSTSILFRSLTPLGPRTSLCTLIWLRIPRFAMHFSLCCLRDWCSLLDMRDLSCVWLSIVLHILPSYRVPMILFYRFRHILRLSSTGFRRVFNTSIFRYL